MTVQDRQLDVLRGVLAGMVAGPAPLSRALQFYSEVLGEAVTEDDLAERLNLGTPDDEAWLTLVQTLAGWDHQDRPPWGAATIPNSAARRARIYEMLGVTARLQEALDVRAPFYAPADRLVVIAGEHSDWVHLPHGKPGYYWRKYLTYLLDTQHWESIADLEESTDGILSRLADPRQSEAWQSRGLVVGYVQSGKTSSFTGVVARAADSGYRLFIILSGRTDILRHQTQRRLDKMLLGQELTGGDYTGDPDWSQFLQHGAPPSTLGSFDWERLTGPYDDDYRSLGPRIHALRFPSAPRDPLLRSGEPQFAYDHTPAKLIVLKKNARVLSRLARDIARVRESLINVPTLVIDDESDEASVNTRRPPTAQQIRERTAINKAISELLGALPRAQYVGYTATPAANILIDPSDAEDLFPRDFIVALRRPPGYMGASDFHDLDGPPEDITRSSQWLHVRDVLGDDTEPENLQRAIDAFVLSGAVKLWRAQGNQQRIRHHTMLVHITQGVAAQAVIAGVIENLIDQAGYQAGSGLGRLRLLWQDDFLPRSRASGAPVPPSFEELIPFLGHCLSELEARPPRVRQVNGEKPEDTPDFDQERIWKILVGGNKLSRGYTIEGLTVSYYRRHARAADTMMQMGRWCGFRPGYRDLVRLFIGRRELQTRRGNFVDLYSLYEGAVRDEIALRKEFERYRVDGEERILPRYVPPLIEASLGVQLLPTARNKMFNAEARSFNFGGQRTEKVRAPWIVRDVQANEHAALELLGEHDLVREALVIGPSRVTAYLTHLRASEVLRFLRAYRWLDGAPALRRELEFLEGLYGNPEIDRWLLFAPQLSQARDTWLVGTKSLSVYHRSRLGPGMSYNAYTTGTGGEREVAAALAGGAIEADSSEVARHYLAPKQAVLSLFPIRDFERETRTSIGFVINFPSNRLPVRTLFGPKDASQPGLIINRT